MYMYINRTDLERAVVAEGRQLPAMLPGEYAGRIWLRLADIDPGGALAPADDESDAIALEKAREVVERRYPHALRFTAQLGYWRDKLNGQ